MTNGPILYAWARPLEVGRYLDHTWVTGYGIPPIYQNADDVPVDHLFWYCWGSYHGTPSRGLGSAPGKLEEAKCICIPRDQSAHGTVFYYGLDGVCHQVANQLLWSTGAKGLTVAKANGYMLSHFFYGTYGINVWDWDAHATQCATPFRSDPAVQAADLRRLMAKRLGGALPLDRFQALLSVRGRFQAHVQSLKVDVALRRISATGLAEYVNALVNEHLGRVASIVGRRAYRALFGFAPTERRTLVDPEMMRRSMDDWHGLDRNGTKAQKTGKEPKRRQGSAGSRPNKPRSAGGP